MSFENESVTTKNGEVAELFVVKVFGESGRHWRRAELSASFRRFSVFLQEHRETEHDRQRVVFQTLRRLFEQRVSVRIKGFSVDLPGLRVLVRILVVIMSEYNRRIYLLVFMTLAVDRGVRVASSDSGSEQDIRFTNNGLIYDS